MKKHIGEFADCGYCQRYIRLGETLGDIKGYTSTTRKLHRLAINRQVKDSIYKDAGLVKVRGNLGGVYWE